VLNVRVVKPGWAVVEFEMAADAATLVGLDQKEVLGRVIRTKYDGVPYANRGGATARTDAPPKTKETTEAKGAPTAADQQEDNEHETKEEPGGWALSMCPEGKIDFNAKGTKIKF